MWPAPDGGGAPRTRRRGRQPTSISHIEHDGGVSSNGSDGRGHGEVRARKGSSSAYTAVQCNRRRGASIPYIGALSLSLSLFLSFSLSLFLYFSLRLSIRLFLLRGGFRRGDVEVIKRRYINFAPPPLPWPLGVRAAPDDGLK